MRNDERNDLEKLVHGVNCDLDVLLHPDNLPFVHQQVMHIALRCREALTREDRHAA